MDRNDTFLRPKLLVTMSRPTANVLEVAWLESPYGTIGAEDSLIPTYAEPRPATKAATFAGFTKLDDVIAKHEQNVLDKNRGNKLGAAQQLEISRSTLDRIQSHPIASRVTSPSVAVDKVIAAVLPVALHSSE